MPTDRSQTTLLHRSRQWLSRLTGSDETPQQFLELIDNRPDNERPNRMCICLSDIHLTDGTVGFQNLPIKIWEDFYNTIKTRCKKYGIEELVFVIDGDFIDMIRTDKWAVNGVYPWQRDNKKFPDIVLSIAKDIVKKHEKFFSWLKALPSKIEHDCGARTTTVVLLGNHDKELFVDPVALEYFYREGLGIDPRDPALLTQQYREAIGRMYSGDPKMFSDPASTPYLPFYYGDCGFRFFTTHGQWRDEANSKAVRRGPNRPGWKAADGWRMKVWQELRYEPFFAPCFGDTVAAGVLSTFIYKVKKQLKAADYHDPRLLRIMDELDLYRPTYAALIRIIDETHDMQRKKRGADAVQIIQDTLYQCIMDWLNWDYTYESSPWARQMLLKTARWGLEISKKIGHGIEITFLEYVMKAMYRFEAWNPCKKAGEKLQVMKTFPAFLPKYRHYKFQIHGEGHTHIPLQEEPQIKTSAGRPCSYINFGTWRNQILLRKERGYRRRGVLRALFILDIENYRKDIKEARSFNYFTEDIIHWNDQYDDVTSTDSLAPNL